MAIDNEEVLHLVGDAWNNAVESGYAFELEGWTMERIALDMMTCDSDIEAFADRVGHDAALAAIINALPTIIGVDDAA